MSDKKRLIEIKGARKRILDEESFQKRCIFLYSFEELGYLDWLIKQAEKAEKYREALEFYADDKSWEFNWLDDIRESLIWKDYGEKSRKALERTE